MALISCPECYKNVSTLAVSCPNCGAPISKAKETKATIQATRKELKLHTLLSILVICISFVWIVVAVQADKNPFIAAFIFFGGIVWYLVTRFYIWWHHK